MEQNIKYLDFQRADKDIYIPSEKEIKEKEKKKKMDKQRFHCKLCTIQ